MKSLLKLVVPTMLLIATVDAPMIAKVKRIHQRHVGAKKSRSPMPFGRNSKLKRKMDGTIVRRDS
jgi:hypothetical protein